MTNKEYMYKWRVANPEKMSSYYTKYHASHPEKRAKDKASFRARYQAVCDAMDAAKSVPCMDCKRVYKPWVMDFDHRDRTTKIAAVSALKRSGNIVRVLAEISKCDVVCANCHRERTQLQNPWSR